MAPLIAEYDRHMEQMTEQMEKYEVNEIFNFSLIKFEKLKSIKWDTWQVKRTGILWPSPAVAEEEYYVSNVRIRI